MMMSLGLSEDGTTYVLRFLWNNRNNPINIVMTVQEAQALRDLMITTLEKEGTEL